MFVDWFVLVLKLKYPDYRAEFTAALRYIPNDYLNYPLKTILFRKQFLWTGLRKF